MIKESKKYKNARAVEAAIKDAAVKASQLNPALDINQRVQIEYFNRFLSRIFIAQEKSGWVLKGGTGALARMASTRHTKDIDLLHSAVPVEDALKELRELASIDLGDHFRFDYESYSPIVEGDTQEYLEGVTVTFNTFLGVSRKNKIKVDLVAGKIGITDEISLETPITALNIPGIIQNKYRLYPVVDQIADKVCAIIHTPEGRVSSREKDLVDLVAFAFTQNIDGATLYNAIKEEMRLRKITGINAFRIPENWGKNYVRLSKSVPYCKDYPTAQTAESLVAKLIDPTLQNKADKKTWFYEELEWI